MYTILKDKEALIKELYRQYGYMEGIEELLDGRKDEINIEHVRLMYMEYYDYLGCTDEDIVVVSDNEIDQYLFVKIMEHKKENTHIYITERVSRLYLNMFNEQMKYRIGCKKYK